MGTVGHIGKRDHAEQSDTRVADGRPVDDAGILEDATLETDAAEQTPLLAFGGMILKVFTQVALVARLGDGLAHLWQFDKFEFTQFGYQFVVALL